MEIPLALFFWLFCADGCHREVDHRSLARDFLGSFRARPFPSRVAQLLCSPRVLSGRTRRRQAVLPPVQRVLFRVALR